MIPLALSGCQPLERLKNIVRGGAEAEAEKETTDGERGLGNPVTGFVSTPKERRKIRKQFLSEIYKHVFAREFRDKESYVRWMNILEQGASVEGVYRGLVLSGDYAQMERGRTTPEALNLFASEMALLTLYRKKKIEEYITGNEEKRKLQELEQALLTRFKSSSLFTLKRVLGEEVLEYMDILKSNRAMLSKWYSKTTVRWNSQGIDFGLKLRNSKNSEYHSQWARQNSLGRIQWEVLNRLHRLMNGLGRILYAKE